MSDPNEIFPRELIDQEGNFEGSATPEFVQVAYAQGFESIKGRIPPEDFQHKSRHYEHAEQLHPLQFKRGYMFPPSHLMHYELQNIAENSGVDDTLLLHDGKMRQVAEECYKAGQFHAVSRDLAEHAEEQGMIEEFDTVEDLTEHYNAESPFHCPL